MGFQEFFQAVKNAEFTFLGIKDWLLSLFFSATENPDVINIWQFIKNTYNTYLIISTIIVIALGAAVSLFGQKFCGIIKFCLFFFIGFIVGVQFLSPIIPESIPIKSWITGLVVATVVAVLYKYLYYLLLSVAVAYSVYRICFTGFFISVTKQLTAGKAMVSLIVALVCVVLVLILRKWIERLLTAFLGGYVIAAAFNYGIWRFTGLSFLVGREWLGLLIVGGVIAIGGFIVQVRQREVF